MKLHLRTSMRVDVLLDSFGFGSIIVFATGIQEFEEAFLSHHCDHVGKRHQRLNEHSLHDS